MEQRHTGEPIEESLQTVIAMGYSATFQRGGFEMPISAFDPDLDHRDRVARPDYVFNFTFRCISDPPPARSLLC